MDVQLSRDTEITRMSPRDKKPNQSRLALLNLKKIPYFYPSRSDGGKQLKAMENNVYPFMKGG